MNDPKLVFKAIHEIVTAARRDLPIAERCALYCGLSEMITQIQKEVAVARAGVDGYLSEKLYKLKEHVGGNLGFDIDHGHDANQQRVFALGALSSAESRFRTHFPELTSDWDD
jgi:hypothetical protein